MKTEQLHPSIKSICNPKRALQLCRALATALLVAGCQNAKTTGDIDPTGVYSLVSVDGKPVPARLSHEGHELEVRSGKFNINADGTCSTTTVFAPANGQEISRLVNATYSRDGATLAMQWIGAGRTIGKVDGNEFTMNNEGMVFVYRK